MDRRYNTYKLCFHILYFSIIHSRFRGPTPEKSIKSSNIRIPEKELKKIIVKIKHNKPSTESQIDEIDHGLDRPEEIKIYRCQGKKKHFQNHITLSCNIIRKNQVLKKMV